MSENHGVDGELYTISRDWTVGEACTRAVSFLENSGVEEARSNVEMLFQHFLGVNRAEMLRDWHEAFPLEKAAIWEAAVNRKATGEPAQYIIGEGWFYGRPFEVTPQVLIPRPETELLVEAVLEEADKLWPAASKTVLGSMAAETEQPLIPTIVDVGMGSGAISVTLASERPLWNVIATDISPEAITVAQQNAARHVTEGQLKFVEGDLLEPFCQSPEKTVEPSSITEEMSGLRIDVLVSNPPYIPESDLADLQPEVRDYEPRLALDGGADGLNPYRAMLEQLPRLAAAPKIVAFELGIGQAREVAELLRSYGAWDNIRIITDYGGIERHVIATKSRLSDDKSEG